VRRPHPDIADQRKFGHEFGVFDTRSNTNRVPYVTDAHGCLDNRDRGFSTCKLSFSQDGAAIAFVTSRNAVTP
jgi:hypothetical protein